MKVLKIILFSALISIFSFSAYSQTVGIGTTKGGATAQVSAGISKIVSAHGGMQMRPQPMGGTQQYIPIVNAGELEFGIANAMQTFMAVNGVGLSEGQANPNLKMVATMMYFRVGLIVKADSNIYSIADLKGKKLPSGYSAAPLFAYLLKGMIANGGLTTNDVQGVPVTGLIAGINAFKEGKIDAVIGSVGAGFVKDAAAKVGGVRFIPFSDSKGDKGALFKEAPQTFLIDVSPGTVGVDKKMKLLGFDYMLWANKDVTSDIVYRVTKAMYENEKELKGLGALWRTHSSKTMNKNKGMEYHSGAIKYYKEVGLMN
ncbi:TAXI family TRAP transporter solute-binding subunit [Alphaproteobacteria bacterium]|nr:TAXI family TRAP transporter solute-binding subunit [Alphaproteobacteria bacterium]